MRAWLLVFSVLSFGSAHAQVRIRVSRTEGIESVGVVPVAKRDAVRQLTSLGAIEVGFIHDSINVYGLPLWSLQGRYCLYMDEKYWLITKAEAADILGIPVDEVSPPWSYWFPSGLLLLIMGLLVFVIVSIWKEKIVAFVEKMSPAEKSSKP